MTTPVGRTPVATPKPPVTEAAPAPKADAPKPPPGHSTKDSVQPAGSPKVQLQTPAKSGTPVQLKSEAMKGDPTLAKVASGEVVLGRGADKKATQKMQDALLKAGFTLPKYGADGKFGGETE